jgi:hypothetical protein
MPSIHKPTKSRSEAAASTKPPATIPAIPAATATVAAKATFAAHPAAALFPMMTEERLAELVDDIKTHGLVKPIEIHENQIIDGRNRLEACKRAGLTPHYKDVSSEVDGDPLGYVASVNLKRRDLTAGQRAAIIAELDTLPVGANQHRKEGVSRETPSRTLADAAKKGGVSRASVARAKAVRKADPALAERVKAGTVHGEQGLQHGEDRHRETQHHGGHATDEAR